MLPSLLLKGENGGEYREATLSRFLLEIFMKYRTVLYSIVLRGIGQYCLCTTPLIWTLPGPVISFPGDKQHCDMTMFRHTIEVAINTYVTSARGC